MLKQIIIVFFLLISSASTASSSGLNSRCEDVPSTDAVDSSSREDDGLHPNDCNGSGPPKSENLKKVHDELERLERSGSFSSQGNGNTAAVAPEGAEEAPAALTQNLSNPSSSISARLGQRAAIESSTDTLVDSSRCQTSTNAAEVNPQIISLQQSMTKGNLNQNYHNMKAYISKF